MSDVKRAARWTEVVVIVVIILLLVAVALPPRGIPIKAHEAEVKAALHNIQLAVEKYGIDHSSAYPAYLVGGEARWASTLNLQYPATAFKGLADCPDLKQLADPLLREGYIDSYPRNPFVHNGVTVHNAQLTMPLNAPGGDPLRNGVDTGRLYGTRFGAYCTSMGQLLGAKYYFPRTSTQPGGQQKSFTVATAPIPGLPPGADVTYPCWDVWKNNKATNPLPGQFIYSASGPLIAVGSGAAKGQSSSPILPLEMDSYVLAAFGGPKTKGKDGLDATGNPFRIPNLPVQPPGGAISAGNPDGICDGIIIMLESGVDKVH